MKRHVKSAESELFQFVEITHIRSGYSPDQVLENTMSVGELIAVLSDFDVDMPVIISNDRGYTYSPIGFDAVNEASYPDDEYYDEEDEDDE